MVCAQQVNLSEFRGHCVYGHTNTLTCYKGGLRKSVNCDYNVCATLYNLVAILYRPLAVLFAIACLHVWTCILLYAYIE